MNISHNNLNLTDHRNGNGNRNGNQNETKFTNVTNFIPPSPSAITSDSGQSNTNQSTTTTTGNNGFTGAGFYITCALLALIIVNLLLTVVLLVQSRRMDERLRAAIRTTHLRTRSHSEAMTGGGRSGNNNIPPSRPPIRGTSFPSIHCPNEDATIDIERISSSHPPSSSSSSQFTLPSHPPSSPYNNNNHYLKKKNSLLNQLDTFHFLVEPVSPSSDHDPPP